MNECLWIIPDFTNCSQSVQSSELISYGFRFDMMLSYSYSLGKDEINFTFIPHMGSYDFNMIIKIVNASDEARSITFSEERSVELEQEQFDINIPYHIEEIDESWLFDKDLHITIALEPIEIDNSERYDILISCLLAPQNEKEPLPDAAVQWVLSVAERILLAESSVIKISTPVVVAGDLHGNFYDLLRIFKEQGFPNNKNYLFLGDYVDRGYNSFDTFLLLLTYKIMFPKQFMLLRGNHESERISGLYGFKDEVVSKYSSDIWHCFPPIFHALPFAAIIDDYYFCVHAGISPKASSIDEIIAIKRPIDLIEDTLPFDLVWSDPKDFVDEYEKNEERGVSCYFGKRPAQQFLDNSNLKYILRAHEMVYDGVEKPLGEDFPLMTIFSASGYQHSTNLGSYIIISEDMTFTQHSFSPLTANEKADFDEENFYQCE